MSDSMRYIEESRRQAEALKEKCKDIPLALAREGSPLNAAEAKELYRLLYLFLDS